MGDRVLVRIFCFQDTHKIADCWSEEVYLVVKQPNPDIPAMCNRVKVGLLVVPFRQRARG